MPGEMRRAASQQCDYVDGCRNNSDIIHQTFNKFLTNCLGWVLQATPACTPEHRDGGTRDNSCLRATSVVRENVRVLLRKLKPQTDDRSAIIC